MEQSQCMQYLYGDWERYRRESQLDEVFIPILNDNPVSTIIDMEDKEYLDAPVVLDKFFKQNDTEYFEFDSRIRLESVAL